MDFQIDIISIFIGIVMLINSIYGLIVYSRNRDNYINLSFFILTITISLWGVTMIGYRGFQNHDTVLLFARLLYFSAILIPTAFIYFVTIFPDPKVVLNSAQKYLIPIPLIVLCILSLYPNGFIKDVLLSVNKETIILFNVPVHIIFGLYVMSYFTWAYWIVLKKFFKATEPLRAQLGYIFIGTMGSTFITLITNLGLLYFGYFELNWVGQVGILFMITLIFYSILKFKLFNIKVVATEIFVFIIWIVVLFKFFLSSDLQEQIINASLLLLILVVGIFLIRSVISEVKQREHIQLLATDLEKANERLIELDRQKSEFVSFATHQLRAPLTAIKGYASLIIEGDLGKVTKEVNDALGRIFESSSTLASIIDDYLNITRIELGTMKYAFETVDLRTLIKDVVAELKPSIDKATNIHFYFDVQDPSVDYHMTADRDKLKQVIVNLIDNAIKYTPKGTINASLSFDKIKHKFVFMIKDNGIGIPAETIPYLFAKFSRAGNANKANIKGTGLGLFVAKEMVNAHHGTIRVESAGEGKGSSFIVELEPFAKA